ncbi:MAG: hypothetical protein ACNA8S_14005 [Deferrisomatales bacterium]
MLIRLMRYLNRRKTRAEFPSVSTTEPVSRVFGLDRGTPVNRRLTLYLGTLPVRLYPSRPVNRFTPALIPDGLSAQIARLSPDIVHLHWLGAGFCRIETIGRLGQFPLFWRRPPG